MWCIHNLFAFGNLYCGKIHFREYHPIYIQGKLTATKAILATADQELLPDEITNSEAGVHIRGTVTKLCSTNLMYKTRAPAMDRKQCKEFAEDIELSDQKWFENGIWNY